MFTILTRAATDTQACTVTFGLPDGQGPAWQVHGSHHAWSPPTARHAAASGPIDLGHIKSIHDVCVLYADATANL